MEKFKPGFLVGAATAAHQVEGNNTNSDYWAQELLPHTSFAEPSGIACDHYNRYEEDIALLAGAGLNAYRFSIEWARIEPEEGCFDEKEIEHYKKVIACCKKHGVQPVVTLLHFTSPKWLIAKAGVFGTQPQIFVSRRTPEGDALVMRAHMAARDAIKALYPNIKVGVTLSMHDLQAQPGGEALADAAWEEEFTHYLPYIKEDDFLGVQNYTRTIYGPNGQQPAPEGAALTQMSYEVYPEALEHVLRRVAKDFKGELIVTENGIATADDTQRVDFIEKALSGVQGCMADGLPIGGYFYWSLMDNFEWQNTGFSA